MKTTLAKLLADQGMTVSMSEGRRLVVSGVVQVNGEIVTNLDEVEVVPGDRVQVGKRREIIVPAAANRVRPETEQP